MNYPEELAKRYTAFYQPQRKRGGAISSAGAVKPLKIAAKILLHPDNSMLSNEELKTGIAAEVGKLMSQVHAGSAEGRWVPQSRESERSAIEEFARFFIDEFFTIGCQERRDLLVGNKFALVEHSCEWLVRGSGMTQPSAS